MIYPRRYFVVCLCVVVIFHALSPKKPKKLLPIFLWQNLIEANKARRSRRWTASGSDWKAPIWRSTDIQGRVLYAGVRKNESPAADAADKYLHSPPPSPDLIGPAKARRLRI